MESLPSGPQWVCETLTTEHPTKELAYVFYHNPIECLQSLLSHPLFEPHISFVPRKVWTSTTKICCIYDEWLSGDHAWTMQARGSQLFSGLPMITLCHSGGAAARCYSSRGGLVVQQDQYFGDERQPYGSSPPN